MSIITDSVYSSSTSAAQPCKTITNENAVTETVNEAQCNRYYQVDMRNIVVTVDPNISININVQVDQSNDPNENETNKKSNSHINEIQHNENLKQFIHMLRMLSRQRRVRHRNVLRKLAAEQAD